jgi:predicted Zn-dependent peptidase
MPPGGMQRNAVAEQAVVVPVKGSDSSYLEMAVPCGLHKCSPEFAAVRLLCELLSRSEGPMWERIRGRGLAYHAGLDVLPWSGQLVFSLAECADPAAATEEMFAILRECREQLSADAASTSSLAAALSEARASTLFSLNSDRRCQHCCQGLLVGNCGGVDGGGSAGSDGGGGGWRCPLASVRPICRALASTRGALHLRRDAGW